jgi:hypothetical protein
MTRDREIERVLEHWLSEGPARMPDHVFTTVIDRIDRVPQRRLARLMTRFASMSIQLRIASLAAGAVVVVGVLAGVGLLRTSGSNVGNPPTSRPSAQPSLSPSAPVALIRDGTYAQAPMRVADLKAMINGDAKLTPQQKTFLIDTAFAMKNGTTFTIKLEFNRGIFYERQSVDGHEDVGSEGTYTFPDDHTIVMQEACACPPMTLRVTLSGDSFRLQIVNPLSAEVDALPQRVLWEGGPYVRQ